jgi:NAD(P)-dependent dehydrogenase (short-subunit alcohol dehydrogenase family)/thioester reductase-like protein
LAGVDILHLAGLYDLSASAEANEQVNVTGTQNVVKFANDIGASCLHHVSSIAAAGNYKGVFTEAMFTEGQELDHAYFRTKFEAEEVVRDQLVGDWRIYRPGIIIGSSEDGEADRVDGPYFAFKLIQKLRDALPQWVPLVGPEGGLLNLVPVDYVAKTIDHLLHAKTEPKQTFHVVDSDPQSLGDVLNTFCRAAHAPEFALRFDRRMRKLVPQNVTDVMGMLPVVQQLQKQVFEALAVPKSALSHMDWRCTFDDANTQKYLAGTGISCPPLSSYAWKIWDYWERHLDPEAPTVQNIRRILDGKVVLITGASSGIGHAVAKGLAESGATIVGVARSVDKLEVLRDELKAAGGKVAIYPTDLTDPAACAELIATVLREHGSVDVLINNAGRSIRRSVWNALDRMHDYERTMQINYFGAVALILAVLPHMKENGGGHIINISSIGTQSNPPRFSAYIASKSALDAFSKCIAPEVIGSGIAITNIHMPLVRTPMIAPTSIYRSFPTISPEEAAQMVVGAIIGRPHEVSTRLGKFGEVSTAIAPGLAQLVMSAAYTLLPESSGKKEGESDGEAAPVSPEAYALSQLMRGVHL